MTHINKSSLVFSVIFKSIKGSWDQKLWELPRWVLESSYSVFSPVLGNAEPWASSTLRAGFLLPASFLSPFLCFSLAPHTSLLGEGPESCVEKISEECCDNRVAFWGVLGCQKMQLNRRSLSPLCCSPEVWSRGFPAITCQDLPSLCREAVHTVRLLRTGPGRFALGCLYWVTDAERDVCLRMVGALVWPRCQRACVGMEPRQVVGAQTTRLTATVLPGRWLSEDQVIR